MSTVHLLGSYFYLRNVDLTAELAARPQVDFFADSGAFSADNSGAAVDIDAYGDWLLQHAAVINCAAGLDVIGDPRATARNLDRLTGRVGEAVTLLPTFHVGSPWPELERLCREHPYVALGGAVRYSRRRRALLQWLVRAHRIAHEHGTRLHGFGLTRPPVPWVLPWYSVDSSYWSSAGRTGTLALWSGRGFVTFRVGTPAARAHAKLIRAYGGDPFDVCARGFGLAREVGSRARADRRWLDQASVASWLAYEHHIRSRRALVGPPPGTTTTGDGLKIYLAIAGIAEIDLVLSAPHPKVSHVPAPS